MRERRRKAPSLVGEGASWGLTKLGLGSAGSQIVLESEIAAPTIEVAATIVLIEIAAFTELRPPAIKISVTVLGVTHILACVLYLERESGRDNWVYTYSFAA